MTEIFTAKSVDEAKDLASQKFGVAKEKIVFEVIEEAKKGIFGIGKTDAKVKATYVSETPVAKTSETSAPEVKPTAKAFEKAVSPTVKPIVSKAVSKTETVKEGNDYSEADFDADMVPVEEEEYTEKTKIALAYIKSVIKAMGIEATYSVTQNEKGAMIAIDGDSNSIIIGRRGETLDAIQYLASIIINKCDRAYYRITVDCFNYRMKRKETLVRLAQKISKTVVKTGRPHPLEQMNPYERRIIHATVSEIEGVTSRSVGEEPFRKVIITSTNPRRNVRPSGFGDKSRNDNKPARQNREKRDFGDRNNRNDRNDRNSRPRKPIEPKALDLSTSFEKDYKRPKFEDNFDGDLYGKLKF